MVLKSPGLFIVVIGLLFPILEKVWAQGGSAIIALVMPMRGEGVHLTGGGVAVPTGSHSMFFNPALLASVYERNQGNLDVSTHQEKLLPSLGLPNLYQTFQAVSLSFPKVHPNWDLALGGYRNYVSFGYSDAYSPQNDSTYTLKGEESVRALGLALRWMNLLSFGANVKFIQSNLGMAKLDPSTVVSGDLGLLIAKKYHFPSQITVCPSAGFSLLTHDFRVRYKLDPRFISPNPDSIPRFNQSDPSARLVKYGLGLTGSFWQIFEYETALDWEFDPVGSSTVRTGGVLVQFQPCFSFFVGRLYDQVGKRWESNVSYSLGFDLKKAWIVYHRLFQGDFSSSPESLLSTYPWKPFHALGTTIQPNFRVQYTQTFIKDFLPNMNGGIRKNQAGFDLTFSL